jgi:DNA-binding response OmpR family regulator
VLSHYNLTPYDQLTSQTGYLAGHGHFVDKDQPGCWNKGRIMLRANYPSSLTAEDLPLGAIRRGEANSKPTDTILVVEDSLAMQRALRRLFESDSLRVEIAADGPSGMELFQKQLPCAVVLDLKLPGISGKELCREFKAMAASVPIVVLSANSEVDDKVLLLELGADDYVTKPFSPKELLARVRRTMRRNAPATPVTSQPANRTGQHETLSFGDAYIDFTSMEAKRSGKPVTLTTQEFKLLKYLAASVDRVISREELLNEVWGYQNYPSTRTVDNYVLRLRQKLEPDPASPRFLLTMHGAGYKFTLEGSAAAAGS